MDGKVTFQHFNLDDAEFAVGAATVLSFVQIQFACGGLGHLRDTAKGILVLAGSLQADGNLVGLNSLGRCPVNVAETALGLASSDEGFASIDFDGITAQAPAGELQADVVDDGLLGQTVCNPGGGEPAVVLPLRELVVVETTGGMF